MTQTSPPPVQAWVFGKLSEAESASLLRGALDEQALFDELIDASAQREDLENPVYRQYLLGKLRAAEQPRRTRWFARPWALAPAAVGAALVAAVALWVTGRQHAGSGGVVFE